ncbi:hypothetical protein MMC07_001349 [Pseudocyphellaria aurata]|nr:hypothetical protein [Pseudocyphellaria aurata]
MVSTPDKDLHHNRRAALASFFSRRQVLEFTPHIQQCMDKLCRRLNNEYKGMFKVVKLDDAFAAFSSDNIIYYAFARSYDFLNYPDFSTSFVHAIDEIKAQIRRTIDCQNKIDKNIEHEGYRNANQKTVFEEILHADLPPAELSLSRLQDEAVIIVMAGINTTKTTMCIACFHTLSNPSIYQRLRQELTNAFPDPTMRPSLPELEKLPYLTAVIQESLRFSYGASQRLPRIFDFAIEYGSHTIPPGVAVSLTCYIQHHDERIFPSSQTFRPDRWLGNPKAPGTDKALSNYLVSFSKGTRSCLGMNLALAELYIGLATLFRSVNMELFETQRDAVDMAADHSVQVPKAGTKGVRVLIK